MIPTLISFCLSTPLQNLLVPAPQTMVELATTAAHFASISYCSTGELSAMKCTLCNLTDVSSLKEFAPVISNDLAGYVAYHPSLNTIIVAYRGASNQENWIANFDFIRKQELPFKFKDQEIKLHYGWYSDTLRLFPALKEQVGAKLGKYPDARILFTGHSSGSALAVLSGYLGLVLDVGYLKELGVVPNRISIVTIGGPRCGNYGFARHISSLPFNQLLRVVNSGDAVTLIPPDYLGYADFDGELFINSEEGQDHTPVVCSEQQPSKIVGSCGNRKPILEELAGKEFLQMHLWYMGVKLGDNSCQLT